MSTRLEATAADALNFAIQHLVIGAVAQQSVPGAQTYEAAALAGLGLIQAPLLGIGRYLESGALVEIIPDFRRRALAVSLVVAHRSNLSRRVRAFMKWIENVLAPYLE